MKKRPNYIYRDGSPLMRSPLQLKQADMYGFFVKGELRKLQATIDNTLNQVAAGRMVFKVLSPYVMTTFTRVGHAAYISILWSNHFACSTSKPCSQYRGRPSRVTGSSRPRSTSSLTNNLFIEFRLFFLLTAQSIIKLYLLIPMDFPVYFRGRHFRIFFVRCFFYFNRRTPVF